MTDNVVTVKIKAQDETGKAFDDVNKRVKGLGDTAKGILNADFIKEAAEGARNFVTSTISAASDLGESVNAVQKIFGASSKQILAWGEANSESFGLSKRAFNEAIVPLGANLKNAGLSMSDVSDKTLGLTKRAADMASVFNTDVGDALEAIQAGLRGEADPLEKYGVGLSEAAVQAQALADTGKKSATELTNQEKTLARVKLIMQQTASTAGDFQQTQSGLANSTRVANAQIEDAKAKMGQGFLPILAKAAQLGGEAASGFGKLPGPLREIIGAAAILAAGFVFLAPKIVSAKNAANELKEAWGSADPKMRSAAKSAAVLAAALAAMQIAGMAFGTNASKGVNQTTDALNKFNASGDTSSDVLKHLDYDLGTLGSGGMAKAGNAVAGFTEQISGLGSVFDESLEHARERIGSIDQALAAMVQSGHAEEARQIFDKLNEAAKKNGISTQDLIAGLPEYGEALAGVNKQQEGAANTAQQLGTSWDALGNSLSNVKTPLDAVNAIFDNLLGHDEAVLDLADAQRKLGDTLKENGTSFRKNAEAADENHRAILAVIKDAEAVYVANINSGMAASDAAAAYDQTTAALEKQLKAAHYTQAEIDALIGKYRGVPAEVNTEIAMHGVTEALDNLADILRKIYGIPTSRDIYIKTHFIGGQGQSRGGEYRTGGIKGAATGGPQGGDTLVGEEGPELVDLPTGSMVYPHANTMQMLAGGGRGRLALDVTFRVIGSGALFDVLHDAQRGGQFQILESAIVPG